MGDTISLFDQKGSKIKDIKTFGYPYISGDFPVFYVLKTNGTGFSSYSMKGDELIKSVDYTSLITSISTDKNGNTLVSNLDGKTFLYSPNGDLLFDTDSSSNKSKKIFTKSNALDVNSQNIAVCTGIDPEYIEIYQIKNGNRIAQFATDTNFRYKSFLQFDNNRIYFESVNKIGYYDLKEKKTGYIDIMGEMREIQFDKNGYVYLISQKDDFYYFTVYNKLGFREFYREFSDQADNLRIIDDKNVYFKLNDKIIKISAVDIPKK
jgi:hypothetical protein